MRILQKPDQVDEAGLKRKELDMLKLFISICDDNNLLYFAVGGTCLGAIRHKGFIPWDDDIDVALPRPDYDKFIKIAQGLMPKNYFLQTHNTDKDYRNDFAKIRDSSTTFIESSATKLKINHGVAIDIFPIDGTPADKKEIDSLRKHKTRVKRYVAKDLVLANRPLSKKVICKVASLLCHFSTSKMLNKLENRYRQFHYETSDIVICHGGAWGDKERCPKAQYGKGVFVDFEGIKVRVPEKYDEYLTQKYGDYMTPPPESQRKPHHYSDVIDPDNSYRLYLSQRSKKTITVITYGTFDLMHYGHIALLERAKAYGDRLIVGVSTDEFCREKGKKTAYDLQRRMQMVDELRFVDLVIPEASMAQKVSDIKKYHADVFILGDDYKESFRQMDEYEAVASMCRVIFLPRTKGVSSTLLKEQLR